MQRLLLLLLLLLITTTAAAAATTSVDVYAAGDGAHALWRVNDSGGGGGGPWNVTITSSSSTASTISVIPFGLVSRVPGTMVCVDGAGCATVSADVANADCTFSAPQSTLSTYGGGVVNLVCPVLTLSFVVGDEWTLLEQSLYAYHAVRLEPGPCVANLEQSTITCGAVNTAPYDVAIQHVTPAPNWRTTEMVTVSFASTLFPGVAVVRVPVVRPARQVRGSWSDAVSAIVFFGFLFLLITLCYRAPE